MSSQPVRTDLVIIGAGPVGLFAVFEAGLLGMSCHLVDNLDKVGGQCAELYPEKPIYDIPALPVCTGQELVDRLMRQIAPFEPRFHLRQQAEKLEPRAEGGWRVTTSAGTLFEAPAVVIAAGAGSFVPRRLPLPESAAFEDRSLFYRVRRREDFRGRNILVAGGGDSALDWLLELEPLAAGMAIVHRRDEFRASPDSVERMRSLIEAGRVTLHIGQIVGLEGSDGRLEAVRIRRPEGEIRHPCDTLLAFYGLKTELGPIAQWGLDLDRHHIRVDTATFETNLPGVFAIGDICTYPGKLKLILSGFHEAALMSRKAFTYRFPDRRLVFRHTTSSSELHKKLGVA